MKIFCVRQWYMVREWWESLVYTLQSASFDAPDETEFALKS